MPSPRTMSLRLVEPYQPPTTTVPYSLRLPGCHHRLRRLRAILGPVKEVRGSYRASRCSAHQDQSDASVSGISLDISMRRLLTECTHADFFPINSRLLRGSLVFLSQKPTTTMECDHLSYLSCYKVTQLIHLLTDHVQATVP